jgi:hypothetical protein
MRDRVADATRPKRVGPGGGSSIMRHQSALNTNP